MAKKKKTKRKPNVTFGVKDMIKAMEFALKEYGDICVCNLLFGCIPGPMNCCIYNKRDNIIYFRDFASEEEAFANISEDEVVVHGVSRKKQEEDR